MDIATILDLSLAFISICVTVIIEVIKSKKKESQNSIAKQQNELHCEFNNIKINNSFNNHQYIHQYTVN